MQHQSYINVNSQRDVWHAKPNKIIWEVVVSFSRRLHWCLVVFCSDFLEKQQFYVIFLGVSRSRTTLLESRSRTTWLGSRSRTTWLERVAKSF